MLSSIQIKKIKMMIYMQYDENIKLRILKKTCEKLKLFDISENEENKWDNHRDVDWDNHINDWDNHDDHDNHDNWDNHENADYK